MAQQTNTGEQQIVANNGGIIDFLKKASEVKKSPFDEAKANQLIEHFGGDPNRIVEAVGKTIGVKDLEAFKRLSFEKYGLGGEQPTPQPTQTPEPSQTDQYLADKSYEGSKGYERGVQLQETIDRGQQLKSNLEQKLAPKEQPINLGNIPEPKSTVPTPIRVEQPYDYERDIQRADIQEEISDVDRRVGQLRTDLASTRKENRQQKAKAVAEEVKGHNLKLQDAISQLEKNATFVTSAPGEVRGGIMVPKQEDSQKVRDLRDIQTTLKKIQKEYEAPQKGEGELQGLWWGLTQTNTARDFATLGMNEMMRAHNVRQAFEKEQAGEPLTEEEATLLDTYKNLQAITQQSDKNIGTQVGSTVQEMLPFMVQFAATSGIGASARTIASQYIKNQLAKTVAKGVAGTAAQVATMPYTYQRYAERRAPVLGEDGNLTAGETPFEAGWKSIAETAAETLGENWASINQQQFRNFMVDKMSDPKVASTFLGKMATRLSQETGVPMVQSAPFELLGEYYTGIMQSAIDQDASFFDPEQQKVLLLSVALASGGASVASVPMKYSAKKSMQNAQAELDDLSNDDYRDAILGITENFTDPEEMMDQVIAAAKQMNASHAELLTGLKYAGKTIAYNQMNDASAINVQRKINEFKSNDGTLTSAIVDGKKVTVRNPENLGQPGKAVFVKNEDGTIKMVNSTDIKDFTVQNEQDVVSDIQAQEEAEMAELEAKDAAVAAAAQAGIEPNRTVKTPSGIAKVVDILPDNTIAVVDAKGNQSSYMIDEVEAYKTDEQKKAEAEAEKQQIEAEKQAAEQAKSQQQDQNLLIQEIERRRQEELENLAPENLSVMASDYLLNGGVGSILSSDYYLQGLSGTFINASKKISEIKNKYASEVNSKYADINSFIGTELYNTMMDEIRLAIKESYPTNEALSIFDTILQYPTGVPTKIGTQLSIKLDQINNTTDQINAKYDAELATLQSGITPQQQTSTQTQSTPQQQTKEQIVEAPQYPVLEDGSPDYDSMAPEQFYDVFSNEFGQEAAMAEITDMAASIDKKIQSLQKKRQNATSANQRATIAREIKSLTEQGDNLRGIIANINERTVTDADIAPAIETRPELQEMPEADRNLWIAENSTDPNEIAEAFEREKQNSPAANLTEWQKATLGVRFTPESFRRHGDWNNMTKTMAKAWISNDGVGIDQFVKDNFEDVPGFEDVTTQDVVDFITANPSGSVRSTTDTQNMLRKKYATVTGKSINTHKFDIDTNDIQVKLDNFLRNSGVNMKELFSTEDVIEAVDNNRDKLSDNEYNEFIEFLDSEIRRQESEAIDWLESGQSSDTAFRRVSGNVIADQRDGDATETKPDATADQYPYLNISDKAMQDLANRPRLLSALGNLSNEIKRTANIINSSEIPANVQEQLAQKGTGYSTGFYANGQVYILSDMSPAVSEAVKTYIHEVVVHQGFRELFRNSEPQTVIGRSYQKFNDLLADVYGSMTTDQIQKLAKQYAANVSDINQLTADQKYEIAEEFLAHMAELELTPTAFQEFIDRLFQIIKKAFKFTNAQFTRSDLLKMINERRTMMSQTPEVKTDGDIRFKRETESELYKLAQESSSFEDFYDKYHNLNFRDAHVAPSTDDRPSVEKIEEGGDFSLIEVANGYHNQPSDYFAPRIGARYYGYNDMEGMQSYNAISSVIKAIKAGNTDVKITAYRAVPKSIKLEKLMDYDWVTFSREYAVGHGEHRFGEGEYKIIKQEVSPEHLWWDGNDINEWGYDTDKTKKYYRNDLLSIWEQVKGQDNETRFRMLGQTGASNLDNAYETNVRMDNLKIAEKMENAGESTKVIRLATGWERGVDGQWRYETPDGNLSEDYRVAETLSEAWDDKELFKAYPQLKDARIGSLDVVEDEEAEGLYIPSQIDDMPTIHAIAPTREELRSVMTHEIQHAIQDIEGFAKGGIPETSERPREEQILLSQYASGDMSAEDFLSEAGDLIEENELYDVRDIIQNNTPEQVASLLEAESQAQEQKYKSFAGEVEARNVQSRIDMTPEQRANTLLSETEDVERGMQIVSTNSKESALKMPETITVDGVERPTKNSKGQAIHTTIEGIQNFWKWFGDSKVVDGEGRPIILYHGGAIFNTFKKPETGDRGLYFTNNKDFAQDVFAMQQELYRRDGNNYEYDGIPEEMLESGEWDEKYLKYSEVKRVYLKIENPKHYESLDAKEIPKTYDSKYDGIIVDATGDFGYKGGQYVVFEPTQIKSATGNLGDFSNDNPDIRFRVAESNQELEDFVKDSKVKETVYHGTPEGGFTEFSAAMKGIRTGHSPEDVGFHFTNDKDYAQTYSLEYRKKHEEAIKEALGYIPEHQRTPKKAMTYTVKLKMLNPMKIGNAKIDRYVIADAKEKGYDSIIGEIGKSTKDFVVFSPSQILIEPSDDIRFRVAESNKELENFVKYSKVKETVYHGTDVKFEDFKEQKGGKWASKVGFWFTNKTDYAEMFGSIQMPVKISMENPLVLTQKQFDTYRALHAKDEAWWVNKKQSWVNKGYDGILIKRSKETFAGIEIETPEVYAVFTPQQTLVLPSDDIRSRIEQERSNVNTDPSQQQKESGNYKKGHVSFDGFDISIENPLGSTRSGTDRNGKKWSVEMPVDYGYFKGTTGADKDHIDVMIGEKPELDKVYVVDQIDQETGKFDEHKVMIGFDNISQARKMYNASFEKGWSGLGKITRTNKQDLKEWFKNGDMKKPFSGVEFEEKDVRFRKVVVDPLQTQINWDDPQLAKRIEGITPAKEGYNPVIDNSITIMERQLTNRGFLEFGGQPMRGPVRIQSANDVAFLFRNLENASSENSFVVFIGKDESYKVLYISTGTSVGVTVDLKSIPTAAKEFGAEKIVFVHNHPSGNLAASNEDIQIHNQVTNAGKILGIKVLPSVIINLDSGQYSTIENGKNASTIFDKTDIDANIPVEIHQFDRQVLYAPSSTKQSISSANDVAMFLSKQKRGSVSKIQAMILDRRNAINKYLLIDGNLSVEELSAQLMAEVGKHGESVILASNGAISPADARTIKRNLKNIDSTLLDVLQIKQDEDILSNYESFANDGLLEPEAKYEGKATNNDVRFRKVSDIGFYSTIENALGQIKQEKGTSEQFKAMLLKNGAKQAEMDWTGWDEQFPDARKMITKSDIQNWIEQNKIEVQEVVKGSKNTNTDRITIEEDSDGTFSVFVDGALDDDHILTRGQAERIAERRREQYEIPIDDTKYSQYQEPGGSNYKEVLLTMPVAREKIHDKIDELVEQARKLEYKSPEWIKNRNEQQDLFSKLNNTKDSFKSSHFDEPNILAHVRFNEREVNGEKVLFLEEIQSDWAQKGKKEGFKGDLIGWNEQLGRDAVAAIKDMDNLGFDSWQQAATEIERNPNYETDFDIDDQYKTLLSDWRKAVIAKRKEGNSVPDMPFKKTDQWVNLALRRMMRYASENGFDRIAWTNGKQQADRYNLSKQVDKIEATKANGFYMVNIIKNGQVIAQETPTEKELPELVGKELAQKIVEDIDDGNEEVSYSGLDLEVGGEGMKAFYDAIIPSAASKLGKPFGAKPEQIKINDQTVLSIPVTEKMKAETKQGMPLFRLSSENDAAKKILDAYYAAREVGRISDKIKGIEESMEEADREAMKELKKQLSTLKQAANLSEKDTRRQIQALQNGLVTYAKKHMPTDKAGKLEINALLGTIKNTNKPEAIEKALEKIDEITSKVNRKVVRRKSEVKVNKLIQYATTNKKAGDMERGKFNIEDTREFAKLKRYNDEATMLGRITRSTKASEEQKDQARTRLDKMIDELSAESSLINSVAMKLVQWRAMGAKTSDALIESLKEDLEYLYETARDAKKEADIIYADKLEADKEFIKKNVRGKSYDKIRNPLQKIDLKLNDFTTNLMGNWETLLTMIGGVKARDKYSLIMPQVNEDIGVNQAFDDLLGKAMTAYGFDSRNKMLKTIQSLSKLDYELAQPIHKKKRIEGEPDKISKMQIIDIYNAIKNENIKESWEESYGEGVIKDLISKLSEADKKFGDAMMEIAGNYGYRTNAVYVDMFNHDRPDVGIYWPSTAMVDTEIDVMQQYFEEGKIPSFFKERSLNRTPKPVDAFGKFTKHVKESEWLLNKAVMLNNLNKVFRDQSVKKLVVQARGQLFYDTVITHLKNQGLRPTVGELTEFERIGGMMVGNWAAAKIGASISVPLKQLISVVNYAEDMPIHEWAIGFAKAVSPFGIASTVRTMWNIPYVQHRFKSGYTEALQYATNATSRIPKAKTAMQRIRDIETIGTRGGDILAVMFGGKPYYDYLIKKGYSQAEAEQKFIEATIRSQQSPYSSTLSTFQNNKHPLSKAIFMFANTPAQYQRKMFEALQAFRHGDMNLKQVVKTFAIYSAVNSLLFVGASALVGLLMKGADPDEDFWENVSIQTVISLFGGMPVINDIVESTSRDALGLQVYDDELPVLKELNEVRKNWIKYAKGEYTQKDRFDDKPAYNLKRGALSMLEAAGLSATNAIKTFDMITRRSEVVTETKMKEAEEKLSELSKSYREKKTMYDAMSPADQKLYDKDEDFQREKSAERLKRAYSEAKQKAYKLKEEGNDIEAEDLIRDIMHSKAYLKNTNFDIQDLIEETKYVNSISE